MYLYFMGYVIRKETRKNLRWVSLEIEEAGFHDKALAEAFARHLDIVNREPNTRYKVYKL